jgi:hypothetical protein
MQKATVNVSMHVDGAMLQAALPGQSCLRTRNMYRTHQSQGQAQCNETTALSHVDTTKQTLQCPRNNNNIEILFQKA